MTVVVVMGTSGSGKTTVGTLLAEELGVPYAEADDFHPKANIEAMSAGIALTDADRWPWLRSIADWITGHEAGGVVTCSALKYRYRELLREGGDCWFLHLRADRALLAERMRTRSGHFMPVSLVDSQLADLEPLRPGEPGAAVDAGKPVPEIVADAVAALRGR